MLCLGFALLKFHPKSDTIESEYTCVINTSTGLFLTNEFAKQQVFQWVTNVTWIKLWSKLCSTDVINIHGPAISSSIGFIDIDIVVCLSCRKWPSVANNWLQRIRIQNGLCPKSLKNIYAMALLEFSKTIALSIRMPSNDSVSTYSSNKHYYSAYTKCVCHLLLNVNSDAMSDFCFNMGTTKVFKSYLLFLNCYKQNNIEDMKSALSLLQEVVENHPTSDVCLVLANHALLNKALLLSGNIEDFSYYFDRMFAIVNSLDVTGVSKTFLENVQQIFVQ
ncbi:unnamed protein product [Mytilus edulis]|uniref:Uncharacterized protein n=1 Tax=Mytilus edulis TaxID=6550 RepID=A0A8S3UTB4_MYTED|nr:unnamed protein product [Mytilus edulis]